MPEVWDMNFRQATSLQFPLRPGQLQVWILACVVSVNACPEFVESTWYLYRVSYPSLYEDIHIDFYIGHARSILSWCWRSGTWFLRRQYFPLTLLQHASCQIYPFVPRSTVVWLRWLTFEQINVKTAWSPSYYLRLSRWIYLFLCQCLQNVLTTKTSIYIFFSMKLTLCIPMTQTMYSRPRVTS